FLHTHALRHGEYQDQFFRFRILFLEVAERDDGEGVHAGTDEQALVVFKDADDFIVAAVDAHRLPHGVGVREKRFGNGRAQHHHGTGVLLVKELMKRPRSMENSGMASVYGGSAPRTITFSTLRSPLVIRLVSPKKKPRVPTVVTIFTSGAASRMYSA